MFTVFNIYIVVIIEKTLLFGFKCLANFYTLLLHRNFPATIHCYMARGGKQLMPRKRMRQNNNK